MIITYYSVVEWSDILLEVKASKPSRGWLIKVTGPILRAIKEKKSILEKISGQDSLKNNWWKEIGFWVDYVHNFRLHPKMETEENWLDLEIKENQNPNLNGKVHIRWTMWIIKDIISFDVKERFRCIQAWLKGYSTKQLYKEGSNSTEGTSAGEITDGNKTKAVASRERSRLGSRIGAWGIHLLFFSFKNTHGFEYLFLFGIVC